MPPYVGMARKQNGGYNGSISVEMPIIHQVVNSTCLKTLRSVVWRCPKLYITLRVLKKVAKVTNLEAVKIQFRHLLFLSSFFSQPSSFLFVCFVGLYAGHPYIQLISFEIFLLSCHM